MNKKSKSIIKGTSLFANIGISETYFKRNGIDIVLANELIEGDFPPQAYAQDWNINGEFVKLAVMRMRKCD